ncbi:carbonyl reductase [NADPH] 1 [Aplysia californica]|uniref:carbonyl reductase (NADPH) n=1 Tax=Aplysia californica TaxID=6500 RepID=A0ABM0JJZ4_APLCA|nr:carbonyl reductase [NADPH] 1 [Aplysia californica]
MSLKRVAVVTGSNKGIGLAIVRGLCKDFQGDVVLTARDEGRGRAAVQVLEKEGFSPKFHLLDISDHQSIVKLRDFLKETYQGLDVLVNNAAILYNEDSTLPFPDQARETIKVNYYNNLDVCEVLFPLLRPHARVCNMSSLANAIAFKVLSPELRTKFLNPQITMPEVSSLMTQFVDAAQENKHEEQGFFLSRVSSYGISKIGLTLMSAIQQRDFDAQGAVDIVVNSCSPGYVNTDMTQGKGPLTVEEGAVTPLYLCLLPPDVSGPRGLFIREKAIYDWTTT